MSNTTRARFRQSAAECVELARIASDPKLKEILLRHAQEWLRLAYADPDAKFQELLIDYNLHQMTPQGSMQRQPVQQQQQKKSDDT